MLISSRCLLLAITARRIEPATALLAKHRLTDEFALCLLQPISGRACNRSGKLRGHSNGQGLGHGVCPHSCEQTYNAVGQEQRAETLRRGVSARRRNYRESNLR